MSQINISFSGVVLLLAGGSGVDPCAAIPTKGTQERKLNGNLKKRLF